MNKQAESRWGSGVIDQLSRDLRSEFPGEQGYSVTNLRLMKRFFLFYNKNGTSLVPKLDVPFRYQAGTEINTAEKPKAEGNMPNNLFTLVPWCHHVEIIRHCNTVDEAIFFMQKTVENG